MVLVSDTYCGDPQPDPQPEQDLSERKPRTNLLLAATIEAGTCKTAVRIRNLSESGALLEGPAFPNVNEKLILRRLSYEVEATVVWRSHSRCGVRFDAGLSVADWSSGTWSGPANSRGQARVDTIQAAVRANIPAASPRIRADADPEELNENLDARFAEELEHVRRLLVKMGNELTEEPIMVQRHSAALQGFDLACQILGHLADVMTAQDRGAAVGAIGMDDLRARLRRKPVFKKG